MIERVAGHDALYGSSSAHRVVIGTKKKIWTLPPTRHSDRFLQIPSMNKCANLGVIQNSFSYSKTSFLRGLFSDRTRPGNTSTYPARPLGHPDERQKHRRCLAPPHERCRASLNATDGTILLIYSLLAGTSQRSPKTAQYWPCYA